MAAKTKYRNKRVPAAESHDGRAYDSLGEMRRAQDLQLLQQIGEISELAQQVRIHLMVNQKRICVYIADFQYVENGKTVIEDFKGYETQEFKLKWKLLQALYPGHEFRLTRR